MAPRKSYHVATIVLEMECCDDGLTDDHTRSHASI